MTPEEKAWKAEEQRQANELAMVIAKAINDHADQLKAEGRQPLLNAACGALVTTIAGLVATVGNDGHRKALRDAITHNLPRAYAMARVSDKTVSIVLGGRKQ